MANLSANKNNFQYDKYSSKDSHINAEMDYISGWRFVEARGSYNSYAMVQFIGEIKGDFAPSFKLKVTESSKVSFEPSTIESMADDLENKRMQFADAEVISRKNRKFLGLPAIDIILNYKKPDKLRNFEAKLVLFKERVLLFKKDERFYALNYVNPEIEFKTYQKAFGHCLQSFKLK